MLYTVSLLSFSYNSEIKFFIQRPLKPMEGGILQEKKQWFLQLNFTYTDATDLLHHYKYPKSTWTLASFSSRLMQETGFQTTWTWFHPLKVLNHRLNKLWLFLISLTEVWLFTLLFTACRCWSVSNVTHGKLRFQVGNQQQGQTDSQDAEDTACMMM